MTYSAHAIILRRRDTGEWDRLYTSYAREHGKLVFLGKGTRRLTAKLAAHLEPYAEVDLVLARGRAMDRVTAARVVRSSCALAMSWDAVRLAAFAAECVDELTREGHRDSGLFDLLLASFDAIPHADGDGIRAGFTLRLLSILGYAPQLDRCLECRSALGPVGIVGFPARGGMTCHRCLRRSTNGVGIPLSLAVLRELEERTVAFVHAPCTRTTSAFASACLSAHLRQPLRSEVIDTCASSRVLR